LEDISFREPFGLVWISEVVHLLGDVSLWLPHIVSMTADNGTIIIRTSTHKQLQEREWYKFFPDALAIDLARHPSEESLIQAFGEAGFTVSRHNVDESRHISTTTYKTFFEEKSFSTLTELSEDSFADGLFHLTKFLDNSNTDSHRWHYEMSAYIIHREYKCT
jgi:hypothetical protein